MPFDPTFPVANTTASSAAMRAQFQSLFDLIQAIGSITAAQVDGVNTLNPGQPAEAALQVVGNALHFTFGIPRGNDGSNGADGPPGNSVSGATVDAVNTLNPGESAQAGVSYDGSNLHFTFALPRGNDGPQGAPFGNVIVDGVNTLNPGDNATVQVTFDGSNVRFVFGIPRGFDGSTGAQGPPFAAAVVDGVNTLNPGDNATVQSFFDGTNVHFTFGLPRGNDGSQGPPGTGVSGAVVDSVSTLNPGDSAQASAGFDGSNVHFQFGIPRGNDGAPGEVTNSQLNNAISGTSANSNSVVPLGMSVSDPPTQGEMQAIANKVDELILALRR